MKKTILIIDNDTKILSQLENNINNKFNVNILKATTFKEALKFILTEKLIHLAILDFNLQDAPDGEILNYTLRENIPSVILTSVFDDNIKDTILKKDIIDYIIKDSKNNPNRIVSVIDRVLKNYDTNVIMVEDSPIQLALAVTKLEKMKLNVSSAKNGQEALDILNNTNKKYSLVLSDYNMPIMDGMELTIKIRETFNKDELGIIILSANDKDNTSTNFIKIGANDFINKPYTNEEFKIKINSTLELLELFKQNHDKEQKLNEQNKKLQMSEMIGNIAHQWRQPLNYISMIASTVQLNEELEMYDTKKTQDSMNKILEKVDYLTETINIFRNYIEEEKDIKNVHIQDIIKNSINIVKTTLDDLNIQIVEDIDYDKKTNIYLIPSKFSEVLLNIITNAKDIIQQRDIQNGKIIVSLIIEDDKVILSIQDNAEGIPEDIIHKVFDPYFTTKHQSQGTGLGLHISYKLIIEDMNGSLIATNINNGAKFTIELPL